jgi:hypothetical protein
MIKDVTATSLFSAINIFLEEAPTVSRELLIIYGLTLTPQSGVISISFPYPIKIARGTALSVSNSTNVGNVTSAGTIIGYTVDNITA